MTLSLQLEVTVIISKGVGGSCLSGDVDVGIAISEDAPFTAERSQPDLLERAIAPLNIEHEATACPQAAHASRSPGIRKSREQMYAVGMALENHLGNACRSAKVAVDLERRMRVPKIVARAVAEEVAEEDVGVVAIVEACPLVQLPSHRPSRGSIATVFEYDT